MRAKALIQLPTLIKNNGKVVTKGYGQIATSIMEDKTITLGAKCLYVYLVCKAGVSDCCYPSNATIMEALGIKSKLTYRDYKDELIVKGLLRVEDRKYKSGRHASNNYYPTKMVRDSYKSQ